MERLARGRGPKGGCNVKVGQDDEQEEQRQGGGALGLASWGRGGAGRPQSCEGIGDGDGGECW